MKNLLFYGTTNYGTKLNSSDNLKFKELSSNFKTYVITYGNKNDLIKHNYVNIMYIKKPKNLFVQYLKFYFFNFFAVKKFCLEKKIDIISSKDPISALIPTIIKIFFIKDLKIIIEHHGDFLNLLLNQRKFRSNFFIVFLSNIISNFTYKNCDLIRGVEDKYTISLAEKYFKNYITFPAWVDYSTYKIQELNRRNLVYVGNIIPRKGVYFLINAFHNFCQNNDFKENLLVVGDNQNTEYFNKCLKLINDKGIKNVEFLGKKSPEELSLIYSSAKLLVMASSYEGLPRVLIESGLCGTPSLASNIQGINDPFGKYGGTILYDLDDIEDFQIKLKHFINDEKIQIDLQEKSHSLSTNLSGKDSFLNNWIEIESKIYEK
jgi:glycosyltransferase involved in cell wall biosynthesis